MMLLHLHYLFTFLLLYFWRVEAVAVNRTIDDTTGDAVTGARPIYLPATNGVWEDATCKGCAIQPDPKQAFKGTWTAATYSPDLATMSIELSFRGTAIYIFFILANFAGNGVTSETACNFTLDGRAAGSFSHIPTTSTDLQYNALGYSQANLVNADHKLVISTSGITDRDIFVNFDYAIYTFEDIPLTTSSPLTSSTQTTLTTRSSTSTSVPQQPNTSVLQQPRTSVPQQSHTSVPQQSHTSAATGSSPSKTNVAAIAGGIVGGVVLLLALILILIFLLKRKRQTTRPRDKSFTINGESSTTALPFTGGPHSIDMAATATDFRNRPETQSDFLQSGTIFSPYSVNPGFSSYYDVENQRNQTSNLWVNNDTANGAAPSVSPPNYDGMDSDSSAYGGIAASSVTGVGTPSRSNTAATQQSRDILRRARQSEIDRQMRNVRQEMQDLQAETTHQPSIRSDPSRNDDAEITEMREQMRQMQEQIVTLRRQQQSDWALGLSDEPPPGYSAPLRAPSGRRGKA